MSNRATCSPWATSAADPALIASGLEVVVVGGGVERQQRAVGRLPGRMAAQHASLTVDHVAHRPIVSGVLDASPDGVDEGLSGIRIVGRHSSALPGLRLS